MQQHFAKVVVSKLTGYGRPRYESFNVCCTQATFVFSDAAARLLGAQPSLYSDVVASELTVDQFPSGFGHTPTRHDISPEQTVP